MEDKRIVLVTGAAKRIGRAIAVRLYQAGYRVAIHYGESEKDARATAEECGSAPLFQANLEKVDEIKRLFREVEQQLGSLYGLVNNAARFRRRDPFEITEADWDFIHNVNLKATFFCCQQGALLMKKTGARPHREHELARRHPALGNVRALLRFQGRRHHADPCAGQGVCARRLRVNSVAPGVILASNEDPRAQDLIAATPAQRSGTPEEIADAVLYFINASNFVTGQVLAVDGGLSQR